MTKLVEDLKTEHLGITTLLEKIRDIGITSPKTKDIFLLVKNKLLGHLDKEDGELYPILKKAAQTNDKLRTTLDFFAKDMGRITDMTSDFFKKYPEGGSGVDFAIAFGTFFGALSGRIRVEEDILFVEYEKLMQAS